MVTENEERCYIMDKLVFKDGKYYTTCDSFKVAIDALKLAIEVIGTTRTVLLNSGIEQHNYGNGKKDIIILDGLGVITIHDIIKVYYKLKSQLSKHCEERSYYYERMKFNPTSGMYQISWGS